MEYQHPRHAQIHKSVWRIRTANTKHVGLQFPEGLLMYACIIADILERYEGFHMGVL